MRHVMEARTDASSLVLFDPGALPLNFDLVFQTGSAEMLEQLSRERKLCWINSDGDGSFLLHAYLGERVPRAVERVALEQETFEEFPVPTGRLVFAGSECAYREDDTFLRNHSHMGSTVALSPGIYRLVIFRTRFPLRFVELLFRNQSTTWEYCLWSSMVVLIPLSIAAWIGLVTIFFTTVHVPFPGFLAPLLALIFASPFLVRRLEVYRQAKQRFAALERDCPAVVAHFEFVPARTRELKVGQGRSD